MAEPGADDRIDLAALRDGVTALYGHRPQALVVGVAFLAIFLWTFGGQVEDGPLWLWAAGMLAMTLNGLYWWRDFRRKSREAEWNPRPHLRLYTLQSWLAGILFGSAGWLFYDPSFGDARWIVVLLLCALAAGTVTVYAYHVPTYLGFVLLLATPLALRFGDVGAPGGWVAYALMAFYLAMLVSFARRQGRMLTDGLRARHEREALARRLEEQALALTQAQDAKSRFFAAASHDLRQPLQALGHYTDLLRPGPHDATHVERIRECVESLDGLLEGVLTLSRLDAGEVQRHLQPVDLSEVLRRQAVLYGGVAAARGLQWRWRVPGEAPGAKAAATWVETDPVLLERVLGNLIANALRYTPSGGVLVAVRRGSATVRLQVIDTGIGIAASDQARIFDEFVQIHNPHRGDGQGVGLGLATVKRICRLLKHPLTLRSRPGRGSTFTLVLPRSGPPPDIGAVDAEAEAGLLSGRILLVEDNALVRESLEQSLQRWGLEVRAFAEAEPALACLEQSHFDVVLTDGRLPGSIQGPELLRTVSRRAPSCLRLLMSGEPPGSLDAPADGVTMLRKPVRPLRLRALLGAHLATTQSTPTES